VVARDLTEPSPLAHEILNASPWAFLDDAPLEERRTQAVVSRRWLDPETAADLGRLDAAAIERVRDEARPDPADADELHDALVTGGWLPAEECEAAGWGRWLEELSAEGRAAVMALGQGEGRSLWIAAERLPELGAAYREATFAPPLAPPPRLAGRAWEPEEAVRELVRSRMDVVGPVTAATLAAESGLPRGAVDAALAALEGEGAVLRGRFTPGAPADAEVEWCERRLLARIHRYTLHRLRREIEPVGRADLARFLLVWQRVAPEERGEGPQALAAVLEQLAGFAAPAAAWEGEVLPARVADYDPAWLDALCLSGRFVWCRATPPPGGRSAPLRTTPITFLPRAELAHWRQVVGMAEPVPDEGDTLASRPEPVEGGGSEQENGADGGDLQLSSEASQVAEVLASRGATFFSDLAAAAGLLHTQAERALAELVACGLVTSDSFTGLRALLVPADRRPSAGGGKRRGHTAPFGMEGAGRWSLLSDVLGGGAVPEAAPIGWSAHPDAVETVAWTLLARYGVLFRALLAREDLLPPWRELLWTLRRLEARGEVRGGRFVHGFSGEQFALPEAVARLRLLRRKHGAAGAERDGGEPPLVSVSGADPLNLAGVLAPGDRLPALTGNRLLYRGGVPLAVREAKQVRFLAAGEGVMEPADRWQAEQALIRTPVPPALRPYLGARA
jgi:ATP-dependent Lhr-like helicase